MSATSTSSHRVGYARVSTDKQTTDQQVYQLRHAGCRQVFVDDGIGATAKRRKGLEDAKAALKPGDIFVVWAIDRAFRSTREAIDFLDELRAQGIEFLSLTQAIDTTTPEGRKWYIDTASWAEYERAIISRRTKEKMDSARRAGKHVGRPYKLSTRIVRNAYARITQQGMDLAAVARRYHVAPVTLTRAFERLGLEAAT